MNSPTMQIQGRLDELNASIERHDADGELLEQLVEDTATTIPSWELRRCWSFKAWPARADFDLPAEEDGIDLVAEKTDGDLVPIECKARSSGNVKQLLNHLKGTTPCLESLRLRTLDAPSVIELVGLAAAWRVLVKPAEAFLKEYFGTLGKKAAEATSETTRTLWKKNDRTPLVDIATALRSAADQVGGEVQMGITFEIPGTRREAEMWIKHREPREIARMLAIFLVHMDKIENKVRAVIERGGEVGGFIIEPREDGVTIRWLNGTESKAYEERIS